MVCNVEQVYAGFRILRNWDHGKHKEISQSKWMKENEELFIEKIWTTRNFSSLLNWYFEIID